MKIRAPFLVIVLASLTLGVCSGGPPQGGPPPEAEEGAVRIENPIITERFSSDPAAMVHDGRVWLYTGHDEAAPDGDFFEMHDWQLYSTGDMVNWTSHGSPISVETFAWA